MVDLGRIFEMFLAKHYIGYEHAPCEHVWQSLYIYLLAISNHVALQPRNKCFLGKPGDFLQAGWAHHSWRPLSLSFCSLKTTTVVPHSEARWKPELPQQQRFLDRTQWQGIFRLTQLFFCERVEWISEYFHYSAYVVSDRKAFRGFQVIADSRKVYPS